MGKKNPDEMTFLEHLEEFRGRLIWVLVTLAVGTAGAYFFSDRLVAFILLPGGGKLQYIKPAEAFTVHVAVSFLAAAVGTAPVTFFHLWRFISPALLPKEKRLVLPFVFATTLCFVAGVAFGYWMLFPAMAFFRSFETPSLTANWTLGSYTSLALRLVLITGLLFESPVLVYFLARLRIVTPSFLLKKWKHILVGIFVVAAVVTPGGDVFTQVLLAAPLAVLYVVSIVVAFAAYPRTTDDDDEDGAARRRWAG